MQAPHVSYKFNGRRKEESFILYPVKPGQPVMFQSEKSIGIVNMETGIGKLYLGKGEHPSSAYLSTVPVIDMPQDFIDKVKATMPKPGEVVSLSGICQVQY